MHSSERIRQRMNGVQGRSPAPRRADAYGATRNKHSRSLCLICRTAKQEQALRFPRLALLGKAGKCGSNGKEDKTTAVGWSLAHGMATKPYIVSRLTPSNCVAELSTFATPSRQTENCGFGALRKSVAKGLGFSSPPPITGNCGFGVWNNHVEKWLVAGCRQHLVDNSTALLHKFRMSDAEAYGIGGLH